MWNSKWVYWTFKGGSLIRSYRIVVPFYNDFENFKEFFIELKNTKTNVQFLVVDNGSSDNFIEEYLNNNPLKNINFLKFESNYGYGGGIKKATNHCVESYIGWMPGNLKIRPADACRFFESSIDKDFDLIKAKRIGRPLNDWLKTLIFGIMAL